MHRMVEVDAQLAAEQAARQEQTIEVEKLRAELHDTSAALGICAGTSDYLTAALAKEQAASCRLREALKGLKEFTTGWTFMPTMTRISAMVNDALAAAPGPCVHQQRAGAAEILLRSAQASVCSLKCPSHWTGERPPHSDECQAVTAALAGAGEGEAG